MASCGVTTLGNRGTCVCVCVCVHARACMHTCMCACVCVSCEIFRPIDYIFNNTRTCSLSIIFMTFDRQTDRQTDRHATLLLSGFCRATSTEPVLNLFLCWNAPAGTFSVGEMLGLLWN